MVNCVIRLIKRDKKKHRFFYMVWDLTTDAPVTRGLELEEFKKMYLTEFGEAKFKKLDKSLAKTHRTGISNFHIPSIRHFFMMDHTKKRGSELTEKMLIDDYCDEAVE